jgi:hypothetical protein
MNARSINFIIGLALIALLSACVTINIYFPAAEVEKAADEVIEEVWQLKPERSPGTE